MSFCQFLHVLACQFLEYTITGFNIFKLNNFLFKLVIINKAESIYNFDLGVIQLLWEILD